MKCSKGICATANIDVANYGLKEDSILETYPSPEMPAAPEHTPEKVAEHFVSAKFNLGSGHHGAAALMARTAVEAAINDIGGDERKTLFDKIDALQASHRITPDLAEWAHQVRIIGKTVAHDIGDITEQDAENAVAFAEMFLMYLFMLPGMLKERQGESPSSPQA